MRRCWSVHHHGVNSFPKRWQWAPEAIIPMIRTARSPTPAAWTTLCTSWPCSGRSSLRLFRPQVEYYIHSPVNGRFFYWNLFLPDIAGGYLCFGVSIFAIGVVTAVIGDIASHFGCTLGIKDSVTAIVFVALGTSIPGGSLKNYFKNSNKILTMRLLFQIPLRVKWRPFRTNTQMPVLVMWRAVTLSMSSWESVSPGQLLPFITPVTARNLLWIPESEFFLFVLAALLNSNPLNSF